MATYAFWEGPKPAVIDLCLETLSRHNPDFELLDMSRVRDMGGGWTLDVSQGRPWAMRSDIIRVWTLLTYGGTWCDADVICLKPIPLVDKITDHVEISGFGRHRGQDHISNVVIAAKKGSPILAARLEEQEKKLKSKSKLKYASIGRPVPDTLDVSEDPRIVLAPRELYMPVHVERQSELLYRRPADFDHAACISWRADAVTYHLWHRATDRAKGWQRSRCLSSRHFMSYLFRKALC